MIEFESENEKKYEVDRIWDNTVSIKKFKANYLLDFYYLVFWKCYTEKKNI